MIIKLFCFWEWPKAGMYMKNKAVTHESWNVYDKYGLMPVPAPDPNNMPIKINSLMEYWGNVYDNK